MIYKRDDKEVIAKSFETIRAGLDIFETELSRRNSKYFGGSTPGKITSDDQHLMQPHLLVKPYFGLVLYLAVRLNVMRHLSRNECRI